MARMTPSAIQERIDNALSAWETLHPEKVFANMTLAQFRVRVAPAQTVRTEIKDAEESLTALKQARDTIHDAEALQAIESLVNGVKADESIGGNDSGMYKRLGYIPQSERKSGLTRKKSSG